MSEKVQNQITLSDSVDNTKGITTAKWNKAVKETQTAIRSKRSEPALSDYMRRSISEHPTWLVNSIMVILAIIAFGALFVSAGKQLAAADIVLEDLLAVTNRLSPIWVSASLVILLMVGELGSLVFMMAASIFKGSTTTTVFRTIGIACACIALGANVTITMAHPTHDALAFQWFLTVFLPLLVLGVGYFAENLLLSHLSARQDGLRRYHDDLAEWEAVQINPEAHPDYKNTLFRNVLDEIRSAQATTKRAEFDLRVAEDADYRRWIFVREWNRHTLQLGDDFDIRPNPQMPAERSVEAGHREN